MSFWKRIRIYAIGFGLGLLITSYFFGDRGGCNIFPSNDVRKNIMTSKFTSSDYLDCKLICNGLPGKHGQKQGVVNTAVMYDNMMTDKFSFRGLDQEGVFYDENYKRFSLNARSQYYRLDTGLFQEGQKEKVIEVIDKCFELMPDKSIPYDIYSAQFIPLLYQMGEKERASELVSIMGERSKEALAFINKYPAGEYGEERGINCNVLQTIMYATGNSGEI